MTLIDARMRAPPPRAVPAAAVARWSQAAPAPSPPAARRPVDAAVNDRFAIWHGDITTLEVDVISYPTDESLAHSNPVSDRVLLQAGAAMKEDIVTRALVAPPCGVAVTRGFALRCRHVLHVASRGARSEAALRECYSNVLSATLRLQARTAALALPPAATAAAAETAARAALHCVRAHLDRHAAPSLVVLAAARGADAALLAALAPGYFPRPPRRAAPALRLIRNPRESDHGDDDGSLDEEEAAAAAAALADSARLLHAPRPAPRALVYDQYERLLRRAASEDLSSVSGIGCLYRSGVDRLGRPVVVFIGKWFPIAEIDLDKALLYLIQLLDPIVSGDYVIAYFHTLAASGNHPPFSWLKEVYSVLPYKYKKNLKAFYIVHPTFWTKMMSWWFTTFMAPAIKAKVHNLPGVEYLHAAISRDQLDVPAFVTEYDMTINGLHYFQPEISSAT